jgi:23S rRNA (uracil1939-C5)-methyltransferase
MSDSNRSGESRSDVKPAEVELEIATLAAGGDGVARDAQGRVTFVPRTAPGDRVRVRLVKQTASFARGEIVEVLAPSPSRVEPACAHFTAGCGGCQWQHVARPAQLEAKQAVVANALRKLTGLAIEPIADPAPALGWRRRARFHVAGGKVGLYATGSHRVVPIASCPQLEPALDAALAAVAAATPPDGELAVLRGHAGAIAIGVERSCRGAAALVGRAGIVGVIAGDKDRYGEPVIEVEPGLYGGPWDFAQAGADGNRALVAATLAAVGPGPGRLLELYAGSGNFTRGLATRWDVIASDVAPPAREMTRARFYVGAVDRVLARVDGPLAAIVLDPPRTGAPEAIAGIVAHAPPVIVYVSCDVATLARDAEKLVAAGYRAERAWPIDMMPHTAHVEVVMRLVRG